MVSEIKMRSTIRMCAVDSLICIHIEKMFLRTHTSKYFIRNIIIDICEENDKFYKRIKINDKKNIEIYSRKRIN